MRPVELLLGVFTSCLGLHPQSWVRIGPEMWKVTKLPRFSDLEAIYFKQDFGNRESCLLF
mgnify:CR=1 FL=1